MAKASAASLGERRGPVGTARSIARSVKPPAPRAKRRAQGKVPRKRPSSCQHVCSSEWEASVRPSNASSQRAVANILQHYQCPITRELTIDPVVAEDGHIYERRALECWLQSRKKSPVTNKPMGIRLVPNVSARQTIEDLLDAGAVDDDAAARFFFARAQMLATRSSSPGPDLEGARRDLARAADLSRGDRDSTNFPIEFRVIDWMAQGVQMCSDAAAKDEETKRWMIEVGNAMRFAISSALTERLTEWKALRVGTRVRVIGDTLELEQLCERPPPGAIEKVNWNPSMQSFAGQVCTIRSMGQPSHMNYILTRAGGSCYSFPYDAIILEH